MPRDGPDATSCAARRRVRAVGSVVAMAKEKCYLYESMCRSYVYTYIYIYICVLILVFELSDTLRTPLLVIIIENSMIRGIGR